MARALNCLVFAGGIILLTTQLAVGLTLLAVAGITDLVLDKLERRSN